MLAKLLPEFWCYFFRVLWINLLHTIPRKLPNFNSRFHWKYTSRNWLRQMFRLTTAELYAISVTYYCHGNPTRNYLHLRTFNEKRIKKKWKSLELHYFLNEQISFFNFFKIDTWDIHRTRQLCKLQFDTCLSALRTKEYGTRLLR
jgi:hypothetical protein